MALLQKSVVERVLQRIEHLPTLPQVVSKILAMTDSDTISAVNISKEMDQSLSAKVLQVAFPQSAWVKPIERSISWLAWMAMVLWVTGLLPRMLGGQADGSAWDRFQRICQAQGGMRTPPTARLTHPILAAHSGRVTHIECADLATGSDLDLPPRAP